MTDCYIHKNVGARIVNGQIPWDNIPCTCSINYGAHKYPCVPVLPATPTSIQWGSVTEILQCGGGVEVDAGASATCSRILACANPCNRPTFVSYTNILFINKN